jgi:hypothetical protein
MAPKPKVWISMGLCFSHNTEKHGKRLYPYRYSFYVSVSAKKVSRIFLLLNLWTTSKPKTTV